MLYTLISSTEKDNTTTSDKKGSTESYKDIATAATELRGQAYAAINYAVDNNTFLLDTVYPKGSIYMSTENVSPASFLGGTWNPINNVFLLAQGSSYSAGGTGGSANVTLTESQMPKHSHKIPSLSGSTGSGGGHDHRISGDHDAGKGSYGWSVHDHTSGAQAYVGYTNWVGDHTHSVTTNEATSGEKGSSAAHDNMPPYLTVYMWKRTA